MYVSKELAFILKEKGFDECCSAIYNLNEPYENTFMLWCHYNTLHGNRNSGNEQKFEDFEYLSAPTEHEVIDWIFNTNLNENWGLIYKLGIESTENISMTNIKLQWLQFWYITLLEHKFSLMYEFIGRLEEWFESNDYHIVIDIGIGGLYHFQDTDDEGFTEDGDLDSGHSYQFEIIRIHDTNIIYRQFDHIQELLVTKQQAKHQAILKCFELMKGE